MTRLVPLLLSALLSTFAPGVEAKSKGDQVRMYEFTSDFCDGAPKGANVDIKRNECVNIAARSLKPRVDEKRRKWIDQVNNGAVECALFIYETPNCKGGKHQDVMYLPEKIDDCYTSPSSYSLNSVKFVCESSIKLAKNTETITTVLEATSWSFGEDKSLTPHTTTETLTLTVTDEETVAARAPTHVARRDQIEPRAKKNEVGVWMLHPWTGTVICYQCYTKKTDDFSWVKCYSGHEVPHLCGARPVDIHGKPITTTSTQTTASTTYVTTSIALPGTKTITHTTTTAATTALPIQARSWHRKVSFKLPWNDVRACADAEWEKRGKPNTEIRLQDVHAAKPGECEGVPSLDLPDPIKQIDTATAFVIGTKTVGGHTAMTTITETHYTYETTLVFTFTDTGAPEPEEPTTTYFPIVQTVTDLVPTVATVTTLVTDELITTVWPGHEHEHEHTDGEKESDSVGDREAPPHRDL